MPDTEPVETEGQAPKDEDQQTGDPQPTDAEAQNDGESPLWEGIAEDHPVRAEVEKLRKEAAAKRTSAQQIKQENEALQAKLAEAKTTEEVNNLIAEWQGKVAEAESVATRERIGRRHALPDEVVELLKGDTEEALEQHAVTLKGLFGISKPTPPPAPPRGGKDPSEEPASPQALLAKIKANRR